MMKDGVGRMDRRRRLESLAENAEDAILLARVYDRITAAERKQIPAATCFLSRREQALTEQLLQGTEFCFFGGYAGAERALCCYLPAYLAPEDWLHGEEGPVCALRAEFYAGDSLTHRDFLGALMGCGIKRETVGDILVQRGRCDFLVTREILPYVRQTLESAGRTRLRLSGIALEELEVPAQETRQLRDTVAALRLDSVVAAGFGLSRGRAAEAVTSGRAAVNWLTCEKPDRQVAEGDVISVRGLGKIELTAVGGTTKKGRIGVVISRFV